MSWFTHFIRVTAVLMLIALTGCVTAPGYRYVVDVGGDYYYDERPAVTTSVHVPVYGALGYGSGGWSGSVGFGFGTYYGLGGYYGPSWGAFGPRYGYAGYWRPPYYYTPRYSRPPHYSRPPYYPVRPLPRRGHDPGYAWRQPGYGRPSDPRRWNVPHRSVPPRNAPPRSRPGDNRWRGSDNAWTNVPRRSLPARPHRADAGPRIRVPSPPPARSAMPRVREAPRDMAIQLGPTAAPHRVRDGILASSRQPRRALPAQTMTPPGSRRAMAAPSPRPAAQPRPMQPPRAMQQQARPAPMQSQSRPMMPARSAQPMTRSAPPPAPRASSRRGGGGGGQQQRR